MIFKRSLALSIGAVMVAAQELSSETTTMVVESTTESTTSDVTLESSAVTSEDISTTVTSSLAVESTTISEESSVTVMPSSFPESSTNTIEESTEDTTITSMDNTTMTSMTESWSVSSGVGTSAVGLFMALYSANEALEKLITTLNLLSGLSRRAATAAEVVADLDKIVIAVANLVVVLVDTSPDVIQAAATLISGFFDNLDKALTLLNGSSVALSDSAPSIAIAINSLVSNLNLMVSYISVLCSDASVQAEISTAQLALNSAVAAYSAASSPTWSVAEACATTASLNVSTTIYPTHNSTVDPTVITTVVTRFTTYCPEPTTFCVGTVCHTVTEATTLTITDCPCTLTSTVHPQASSEQVTHASTRASTISPVNNGANILGRKFANALLAIAAPLML